MKLVFALVPALLFASAASGQEVAAESAKDLWCGIAFGVITAEAPADATAEQQQLIQQYTDGGTMLVDRAKTAHIASGFTEESFATHVATLTADVTTQVHASGTAAAYSFEECSALIGL
jgi:hypothetical protein